jgi:hypothetical protein
MPKATKGVYAEETKGVYAEEMNYLDIAPDICLTIYVAKEGVTKEQMRDHYQQVMLPWLKDYGMTRAKCWVSQHGDLLSLNVQVVKYTGEWSTIPGIHDLYRSDSGRALMKTRLLSECYVNEI